MGDVKEILKNPLSHTPALFWVELSGIEIILVDGGAIGMDVVGCGYGVLTARHMVTVYEIDVVSFGDALEEGSAEACETVPTHGGNLFLVTGGDETVHVDVEDAKAVGVAFFGMAAHQLLADADA